MTVSSLVFSDNQSLSVASLSQVVPQKDKIPWD